LESALLLALLRAEGIAWDAAVRLRRYLETSLGNESPDPIQAVLANVVLGKAIAGAGAVEATLSSFAHFTAARKSLMFQTLLAELGAAEFPEDGLTTFGASNQQSWLQVEMRALKIMAADGTGRLDAVTDEDWAQLAPAIRPGLVWEGNHLARLLGLMALRKSPAHRQSVREAILRVANELRPDGGLPFITGMDVFATAIAGIALTRHDTDTGLLIGMADAFAAQQHLDGGFGYTVGVAQSDVDDTSYGIEFLRAATPRRHARTIAAAEAYLLALRNHDGGFPTFARGNPSEVAMTAAAVNALAPETPNKTAIQNGVAFIVRQLRNGQNIERSWSRNTTNAAFRAILACATLPPDAPAYLRAATSATRRSIVDHLIDTQHADGGWGHESDDLCDPISTSYAAIALADNADHNAAFDRALDYLINQQQSNGGYLSKPDQAGPRPLLYNVPALADVCVLLAITHVARARHAPAEQR
jgi:squalene-hopene/tetraprenyl-beta-curcumene cyclase/sporulenol synthase